MNAFVQLIEKLLSAFPSGSGHLAGLGLVVLGVFQGITTRDWVSAGAQIATGLGILFGVQGTVQPPAQSASK